MELADVRRHLLKVRKDKGLTQDQVAEPAGTTQPTISRLEDVETEMAEIEFETIRKIVEDGLKMPLSQFLLQIERSPESPLHDSKQPVDNKEDKNQLPQEGAHDRSVPASRRQTLVDLTVALLDVVDLDLLAVTRKQAAKTRTKPAKKTKGTGGHRGSMAR